MNVAVLGTGAVGQTIGTALIEAGHSVRMGSRSADNAHALAWASAAGRGAEASTFAGAVEGSDLVFNCTLGQASLAVLESVGEQALAGRVVVDVANPLDFSRGMPPTLTVCNDDSLGEQLQRAFPRMRLVKALNTMNHKVMVDPSRVSGSHCLFMCGNDPAAKALVANVLRESFGWSEGSLIDLGNVTAARGMEMLLPLWAQLWGVLGSPDFNFQVNGSPTSMGTLEGPVISS